MKYKVFGSLLGIIILYGCDYYDSRLEVANKRGQSIAVETFLDSIPNLEEINATEYYLSNLIYPNESTRLIKMGSTKGWIFRIKRSKNDRLNLFVFQEDSLKKYGVDSLITKGIYDRYLFSEVELGEMNWKVTIE